MPTLNSKEANSKVVRKSARPDFAEFVKNFKEVDSKDIYELFGLERFCEMTESNKSKLKRARDKLLLIYHPDKNIGKSQREIDRCNEVVNKIKAAEEILTNADNKRRHDIHLRTLYNERTLWDRSSKWCKWFANIGCIAVGIGMIVAGVVTANGAIISVGGGFLSAGIDGTVKSITDPDASLLEHGKNMAVGFAAGVIGASLGVAAGPAIAAATVVDKILISAAVGGASTICGQFIQDGTDIAITAAGGVDMITDCRNADDIFSTRNAIQLAGKVAIGCAAGAVGQAVTNSFARTSSAVTDAIASGDASKATSSAAASAAQALETSKRSSSLLAQKSIKAASHHSSKVLNAVHQKVHKPLAEIVTKHITKRGAKAAIKIGGKFVMDTVEGAADSYSDNNGVLGAVGVGLLKAVKNLPKKVAVSVLDISLNCTANISGDVCHEFYEFTHEAEMVTKDCAPHSSNHGSFHSVASETHDSQDQGQSIAHSRGYDDATYVEEATAVFSQSAASIFNSKSKRRRSRGKRRANKVAEGVTP